jgi:hypothetical protein
VRLFQVNLDLVVCPQQAIGPEIILADFTIKKAKQFN